MVENRMVRSRMVESRMVERGGDFEERKDR